MIVDEREELEAAQQLRRESAKSQKPKDAKCEDVKRFRGSPTDLRIFLLELDNFFELKPETYPDEDNERKIRYVATRLEGATSNWWAANFDKLKGTNDSTILDTCLKFLEDLKLNFDNPTARDEARTKFSRIHHNYGQKALEFVVRAKEWNLLADFKANEVWQYIWDGLKADI